MDYTAVELGKKIKAGEVSVLEAANAAMDALMLQKITLIVM